MGLGVSFLEILVAKSKDIGGRPLVFIGSCFGGIVVAQVRLPAFAEHDAYLTACFHTDSNYDRRHYREPLKVESGTRIS